MPAMTRTLPPLAELAEELASTLGGAARILHAGPHDAAAAIAFDGHHLLLVRDHGWTVSLSLPTAHAWSLRTPKEWAAAEGAIRAAVASYPRVVTMTDAIVALAPSFARLTPSFPGTPIPRETWLRNEHESVGLFQDERGVRIVVWIERAAEERRVEAASDLAALAAWLEPRLERQRLERTAAEAEARRRAALPLPELGAVLAFLRSGGRVCTSGGRYHETFFFVDGTLTREIFDEGDVETRSATTADLRAAIAAHPERFHEALGTLDDA